MVRRIAVTLAAICLFAAPLSAQRVEIGVGGGYTLSEGVETGEFFLAGNLYTRAEVRSAPSWNVSFGVYTTPQFMIEFMYGRQFSKLSGEGPGIITDVANLNVDSYHGNFVYHFTGLANGVRPFAFVGLGATHYGGGDILLNTVTGSLRSETQFSTTWGAGVKFDFPKTFGVKFTARWTPTYIKSDPAGYWCDPFYGCWVLGDADYSHQFDLSGGVTIRF